MVSLESSAQVPAPALQSHLFWSSECTWNTLPSPPPLVAQPHCSPAWRRPSSSLPSFYLNFPAVLEWYVGQHGKGGGSVLTSPWCPHCACTSLWGDPICRCLLEGRWPTAQNYQRTTGKAVRKRPIGQCGYNNHNVLINVLIFNNLTKFEELHTHC